MTVVTISVFGGGMTSVTGHLVAVLGVGGSCGQPGFLAQFVVTVRANRPVFHILFGQVGIAIAVHIGFLVAIHAEHTLLVMHVGLPAVFTGIFGINPAAVAESAGFAFILLDEFVALDEADADPADRRRFDMATAAGGMAAPAGLLKNLFVELFQLRFRKTLYHTVALSRTGVVQCFLISARDFLVARGAGLQIVGRPFYKPLVGFFPGGAFEITLVTAFAAHGEMGIRVEQGLIDEVPFVHVFRPDRRRRTRSPLSGMCVDDGWFVQRLYG